MPIGVTAFVTLLMLAPPARYYAAMRDAMPRYFDAAMPAVTPS